MDLRNHVNQSLRCLCMHLRIFLTPENNQLYFHLNMKNIFPHYLLRNSRIQFIFSFVKGKKFKAKPTRIVGCIQLELPQNSRSLFSSIVMSWSCTIFSFYVHPLPTQQAAAAAQQECDLWERRSGYSFYFSSFSFNEIKPNKKKWLFAIHKSLEANVLGVELVVLSAREECASTIGNDYSAIGMPVLSTEFQARTPYTLTTLLAPSSGVKWLKNRVK